MTKWGILNIEQGYNDQDKYTYDAEVEASGSIKALQMFAKNQKMTKQKGYEIEQCFEANYLTHTSKSGEKKRMYVAHMTEYHL